MIKPCALFCVLCWAMSSHVIASAQQPAALDQQLLEGLSETPTNDGDAKRKLPPKDGANVRPRGARIRMRYDGDGEDLGEREPNPLERIADRMNFVQQQIGRADLSATTQQAQLQISQDLAQLIKQAEQRQSSSQSAARSGKPNPQPEASASDQPSEGASDSSQRIDQGASAGQQSTDVQGVLRRVWGHLPEKMREQMQNSASEEFLPKYEKLIEDYYRRLAEKDVGRP